MISISIDGQSETEHQSAQDAIKALRKAERAAKKERAHRDATLDQAQIRAFANLGKLARAIERKGNFRCDWYIRPLHERERTFEASGEIAYHFEQTDDTHNTVIAPPLSFYKSSIEFLLEDVAGIVRAVLIVNGNEKRWAAIGHYENATTYEYCPENWDIGAIFGDN